MPTGYTASVQDGTVTSFQDFAEQCLRAFGVAVHMRDEPFEKRVPDVIEESSYYSDALKEAEQNLLEFKSKTVAELQEEYEKSFEDSIKSFEQSLKKEIEYKQRYQSMLDKVNSWNVPDTSEVIGIKKFMIEQLESSIEFDCDYYSKLEVPVKKSFDEWIKERLDSLEWQVNYHTEEHEKERDRAAKKNEFIKEFRELIKGVK